MTATPNPRAAVYCRVSSEEQRERQSIDTQRDFAERFCALHEIPVNDYYTDNGVSGTLAVEQRPEGRRLLRDAREGCFQMVLVYRLDRLGRNAQHILNVIAELEALGVQVKSMTEPFDTGEPVGRFMVTMLSGVAGLERDTIVLRAKAGSERVARSGGWLGGHPPFGYRVEGKGKQARLVLAEQSIPNIGLTEAELVRRMYRMVGEERQTCRQVADYLNAREVQTAYYRMGVQHRRTSTGRIASGYWTPARVRNVLVSTVYKGLHQYGKRDSKGKLGREVIERPVTPLVSVELWEQTQAALKNNMRFSNRNAKHQYLLRGLIKCGTCGRTLCGATSRDGHSYYRCPAKYQLGGIYAEKGLKCPSKPVPGQDLEAMVWADIDDYLHNPGDPLEELRARLFGQRAQEASRQAEVGQIEERLHLLNQERDSVLTLYRKGRIDGMMLDRQLDHVAEEEQALKTQLAGVRGRLQSVETVEEYLRSAEALLQELRRRANQGLTWETKRQIVECLVQRVQVDMVPSEGGPVPEAHVYYHFGPIATFAACRASPTRSCRTTAWASPPPPSAPASRPPARPRQRASRVAATGPTAASSPTPRWGRRRCASGAGSTRRGRG